ncbi:MAG TPA: efflux RND transporter periplasmic adaptor subunit [Thermoanaerobaculia bacterium]|nr:efflux RND transporter periplasmic adaptor subunit [Thermoanaerobaculia bacterium]
MIRDLRITVTEAESRPGGEGVNLLGEVSTNEDAYAEVGSVVVSRVVRALAAPGDSVRRGQALVELQSVELGRARADILSARARAEVARAAVVRKRELAGRVVPVREVQEAEADARAAEADLQAAIASLRALGVSDGDLPSRGGSDRLVLRSPISGTVIERSVVAGQMTDPSKPLFRVGDLSRLWLTVHAYERDAVRVRTGSSARVTFPALPGRIFTGAVTLVGRQVDVVSRTIPVRVEVENTSGVLRPGMSATAWVRLGEAGGTVVAVPAASLQRLHDEWRVFIPKGEGTFEIRTVGRGRDLGGEVEIVSGLRPRERVVVDGAFLLKAEAEKAGGEGERHEH